MAIADGPVIIGGGPSGLAAAIELRRLGIGPVTVIEREREAGGIPRHSAHTGFGLRDLRTVLSGPRYAERYRDLAADAGAELITKTMVTDWEGERLLNLTGPEGREQIEPPAVVLATGCRERPRSARLVPGSRPAGVMTTSTLQQLVHLRGERVGSRAVIVGAEHVSFSAVATLAHAGASVAGLVTELPRHQSLAAFRVGAAVRYRARVWSRTAVSAIHGADRVESVELTDLDSGRTSTVDCDLVIFTADWVPDHELAVIAGCELDPGSLGRSSTRRSARHAGAFSRWGTCCTRPRPLTSARSTADTSRRPSPPTCVARESGRHTSAWWPASRWPGWRRISFRRPDRSPPHDRFLLRSARFPAASEVQVRQDGRELGAADFGAPRSGPLGPHPRRLDLAGGSRTAARCDRVGAGRAE